MHSALSRSHLGNLTDQFCIEVGERVRPYKISLVSFGDARVDQIRVGNIVAARLTSLERLKQWLQSEAERSK